MKKRSFLKRAFSAALLPVGEASTAPETAITAFARRVSADLPELTFAPGRALWLRHLPERFLLRTGLRLVPIVLERLEDGPDAVDPA